MARPRRQEWRGRLILTGDTPVDNRNRAKMLDVLHESLMRARESTLRALRDGPVRVGEVVVGEHADEAGPPIEAEVVGEMGPPAEEDPATDYTEQWRGYP